MNITNRTNSRHKRERSIRKSFNKKGDTIGFLPMVLIKLIFAAILILLITWLMVSLWQSMFGNTNKTEKDNFNTLFKLMESKSNPNNKLAYDSTRLSVYLIKTGVLTTDHTIQFFGPDETFLACGGGIAMKRPNDCSDIKKSCLCLFDSDPDRLPDESDDDLIECKQFSTGFKITTNDFQISNKSDDCLRAIDKEYMQLIVGQHTVGGQKRVFVWQDSPENRKLDEQLQLKQCPSTSGICANRKDGEIVYDFQQVAIECSRKDPNKFYTQAKCIFDGKKCDVECTGTDCSAISTCTDFNINQDFYVTNTKEEYFCKNRACNKQCSGNLIEQYTCLPNKEQECKDLINDVTIPDFISNCAVIIGPFSNLTSGQKNYNNAKMMEVGDIIGYDSKKQNTNNINCKVKIEEHFRKYNVLACIPGVDCNSFVIKNPKPPAEIQKILDTCGINPQKGGGTVFITQYGVCNELTNYFTDTYNCADAATPRFV